MESAAYGCATITTNRGGLGETFDNNLILNELNATSLEKLITKIIKNNKLLKKIQRHNFFNVIHNMNFLTAKIDNLNANEAKNGSVDTTSNILECINFFQNKNKYKIDRFIYFSSSMVYGDFKNNKAYEDDDLNPKEAYGTMKLA